MLLAGSHVWKCHLMALFLAIALPGVRLTASFVDVTASAVPGSGGVLPGGPAHWADYNNDGYPDLLLRGELLRNNGNGTFVTVNEPFGDAVWGDYNKDGYVDLFDYSTGNVWRNDQGNGFTNVSTLTGLPIIGSATWGDFNGDGYLDIYVGGYENPNSGAYYPDYIYTNNRNGTFTKTWTEPNDAVTTPGQPRPARGVTTADWNQDGALDIYASYYRLEPNGLWQNNGSGVITDVASSKNAVATSPGYSGGHSIGAAWADFNNDGYLDLLAANFAHTGQPQSRFLKNLGPSAGYAFQDMGPSGVFYQESYGGPTAGDIDNDGKVDVYLPTTYAIATGGVPNYPILYHNDGNFSFSDVTTSWGLPKPSDGISTNQAAFADFNNDGYLDLVTNGKLYANTGGTNHYLKVRLNGNGQYDAAAIGSQVRIRVNGQTYTRQVEGAVGEGNQNDSTLDFGLGNYSGPLTLQISWPHGPTQNLNVTGMDRTIVVKPPTAAIVYSEDFTSGASVNTLARPWTMWYGSTATPSFNFPLGTVPSGAIGVVAPGPADGSRAVAAIALPASFDPTTKDYRLAYDIYVPSIASSAHPSNQLGIGFATRKPTSSSVDEVAVATIVSNTSPTNEAFYDTAFGVGGADYTLLQPSTRSDAFMGVTVHVEMDLLSVTGTLITLLTGAGGVTAAHTQSGLDFSLLRGGYLMMYTQGDGGYLSNLALNTWLSTIVGDYNDNGVVDAADYVVWLKNLGAPAGTLPNDLIGGTIGAAQYNQWRENFGASIFSSSLGSAFVPEPPIVTLALTSLTLAGLRRHKPTCCGT
jgi:enediyne biosynthesis protein E4